MNRQAQSKRTKRLSGLSVLVTRPEEGADNFSSALRREGAEPVELATIRFQEPDYWSPVDDAIGRLVRKEYDWCIFTSANGVRFFVGRLGSLGYSSKILSNAKIGAVGPATAKALQTGGLVVDLVPDVFIADEIVKKMGSVTGSRILLPRADIARERLPGALSAAGAQVEDVAVYQTVAAEPEPAQMFHVKKMIESGRIDVITFTSASAVHSFMQLMRVHGVDQELIKNAQIACIGPITAQALEEFGLAADIVSGEHTIAGLVEALIMEVGR